jgi:hypothetical protein
VNAPFNPGTGLLFMKVGVHACESLEDIIARKDAEIREAGYAMWGYGGNTCHPGSMVQPFAETMAARGQTIQLCMEEIDSHHFAEPLCAAEYSIDGLTWETIPEEIKVKGSRYALVIDNLHKADFKLPLNRTQVPIGKSTGKYGSRYISGRVDKACLEIVEQPLLANDVPQRDIAISLVANLRKPYAVFLRGQRA